jgi:hypothetical protein
MAYSSADRHITEEYLCDAFDPDELIHLNLDLFKPNLSILKMLGFVAVQGESPSFLVQYIGARGLPHDLHRVHIPTACLNIDTFSWTSSRLRWAMLFDYVFVWQPSFVSCFQKAGHPKVFLLPHAVEGRLFDTKERQRCYELGWVGRGFGLPWYRRRDRIISHLSTRFRTNEWRRWHSKQETAEVYQHSKIVVNVSRDEFPLEANMRCYEAMAAGALLITGLPTELSELGFREGEHFIGWRDERQIADLLSFYLAHEQERRAIARAGQQLVLGWHTYQQRKKTLLSVFEQHKDQFFAPARKWPLEAVQSVYLEYYYRHGLLAALLEEFQALRGTSRKAAWKDLPMVAKALRQGFKRSLR